MPLHWPAKGPNENQNSFDIDWSGRLNAGDSILTSDWIVVGSPSSITINSKAIVGALTKVFLSGGTPGQTYIFQNTIATLLGEGPYIRTASLLIRPDL